ncbi:MAG: hypothetical protein M1837_003681 [Sclerophora amabilis]|nr:MAG: hypothetical protein M1837_003681 [Sclerophora amabilis]
MSLPIASSTEKPSSGTGGPSSTTTAATSTTDPAIAVQRALDSAQQGEGGDRGHGAGAGSSAAQKTKSQVEEAAERVYEERMEDEYAKREGGA